MDPNAVKPPFVLYGSCGERLFFYIEGGKLDIQAPEPYVDRELKLLGELASALVDGGVAAEKLESKIMLDGSERFVRLVLGFDIKDKLASANYHMEETVRSFKEIQKILPLLLP